jgi:lipopolysaccharide biosynthesis regulator YciM
MVELLWLLLPVAAMSGWFAAKRSALREKVPLDDRTPVYFKGLNFLLNEQPDKAIDVFVKMLEVDSETVETHLALGNLFRRRGEVDRAIRIHQNLIARPTLTREQRALALLELGQDYMRAGLFDRAESLFTELGELKMYQEQALSNLHEIYQQEKEWNQCLLVARKLEQLTGKSLHRERAHYYCELAEEALESKDYSTAISHLRKAQSCDNDCVRATMLQGDIETEKGACKLAIKTFKKVEQQDPDYLSEVLPSLVACHRVAGNKHELMAYLRHLSQNHRQIAPVLEFVNLLQVEQGDQEALRFLTESLQKNPNLKGLDHLIRLNLKVADRSESETLEIIKGLVSKMLEDRSGYQCSRCGFQAKTMHWQCPGCKAWSSIKPV